MTWWDVLSTQEIKQDCAKTVNNTLWTNSACRTDSSETDKKPHSQNLSWNTIAVCDTLTCFQVLITKSALPLLLQYSNACAT
jgi:hypothetical protein